MLKYYFFHSGEIPCIWVKNMYKMDPQPTLLWRLIRVCIYGTYMKLLAIQMEYKIFTCITNINLINTKLSVWCAKWVMLRAQDQKRSNRKPLQNNEFFTASGETLWNYARPAATVSHSPSGTYRMQALNSALWPAFMYNHWQEGKRQDRDLSNTCQKEEFKRCMYIDGP